MHLLSGATLQMNLEHERGTHRIAAADLLDGREFLAEKTVIRHLGARAEVPVDGPVSSPRFSQKIAGQLLPKTVISIRLRRITVSSSVEVSFDRRVMA